MNIVILEFEIKQKKHLLQYQCDSNNLLITCVSVRLCAKWDMWIEMAIKVIENAKIASANEMACSSFIWRFIGTKPIAIFLIGALILEEKLSFSFLFFSFLAYFLLIQRYLLEELLLPFWVIKESKIIL